MSLKDTKVVKLIRMIVREIVMSGKKQWIVQWKSTQALTHQWMSIGEYHSFIYPVFILIIDGQAIWKINGERVQVSFGQLIAVEAYSLIEVLEGGQLDLSGWCLEFNTYGIADNTSTLTEYPWSVPVEGTYQKVQLTGGILTNISQHLSQEEADQQYESSIKHPYMIYELLNYLYMDRMHQPDDQQTLTQGIIRSAEYMQTHYDQVITRKQLAEIAGVSPWYYSRKFSERFGKSPLEYLASFRMYRAQEQLIFTQINSQDIAKKSGFEDTHYFSRRFKQLVGVSPTLYADSLSSRRIVCLSSTCADIMIHLGIIPYAVIVTPILLAPHQFKQFEAHGVKMVEIAQYEQDIGQIQQLEPELLVGNVWSEEVRQQLRAIAPLITSLSIDVMTLLEQLSSVFNKQTEAQQLQIQLEQEITVAKQALQPIINAKATIMVLRVEPFGYRYLGVDAVGIARLLYHQLDLSAPEVLQEGKAWFNPCTFDLLLSANPDYLFIEKRIIEQFSTEESMNKLIDSDVWQQLKAVQQQQVFDMDTRLWVEGRGIQGYTMILDEITTHLNPTSKNSAQ